MVEGTFSGASIPGHAGELETVDLALRDPDLRAVLNLQGDRIDSSTESAPEGRAGALVSLTSSDFHLLMAGYVDTPMLIGSTRLTLAGDRALLARLVGLPVGRRSQYAGALAEVGRQDLVDDCVGAQHLISSGSTSAQVLAASPDSDQDLRYQLEAIQRG